MKRRNFLKFLIAAPVVSSVAIADKVWPPSVPRVKPLLEVIDEAYTPVGRSARPIQSNRAYRAGDVAYFNGQRVQCFFPGTAGDKFELGKLTLLGEKENAVFADGPIFTFSKIF